VSVLTPISMDHMRHLGESLRGIAAEKCGIIKRGVPTVVAFQPPEVMEVIRRTCDDVGSPLCLAIPSEIETPLGLAGEHQRQNAACAVEAAHLLAHAGLHVGGIVEGLAEARWPGRIETVTECPRVILDGAHNVAGAEALGSYVRSHLPRDRTVLLIGAMAEKDVAGMIRQLAPLFREVICCRAPSERAASPKDIAAAVRSSGAVVSIEDDVSGALARIMKRLDASDALVIAGSLTVVGAAKQWFADRRQPLS
jgi:dihydrofolate synthase/folylpolyglutamate synthase